MWSDRAATPFFRNILKINYCVACRSLTGFRVVVSAGSTTAIRKPSTSGPTSRQPPSSVSSV